MTQVTQTFESGTNGNTITTGADSAAATSWQAVSLGAGAAIYSNSSPAVGTLSGKFSTSSSSQVYASWTTEHGTLADHYGRFYLKTSVVNATRVYASFYQSATLTAYLYSDATGHLGIDDKASGFQVMTTALSANTWYRVEYHLVHSATVGQFEIKLFSSIESATPTETLTSTANKNLASNITQTRWGIGCGVANYASTDVYLDNIVVGATAYPGQSFPINTVAPVASGTGTVGQVLSVTNGTWTGDATIAYTYQWQRNGSNIGSATASTYTLVTADGGTTVRCVVTGTNSTGTADANSNGVAVTAASSGLIVAGNNGWTFPKTWPRSVGKKGGWY